MKKGRILVTGAGGFAGKTIARYLMHVGYEILATVHRHKDNLNFPTVYCDITKPLAIQFVII